MEFYFMHFKSSIRSTIAIAVLAMLCGCSTTNPPMPSLNSVGPVGPGRSGEVGRQNGISSKRLGHE
jgi:hypothetical protein